MRQGSCGLPAISTPTKTRILAGGIHSAKQQVVRIDRVSAASDHRMPTSAQSNRGC